MAGSPPKPPPPTSASGSSSSPKPQPTLAAVSSSPQSPPPNFTRHPSYEELMDSYLRPRVVSGTGTEAGFIHEVDFYSADPDLLTSRHAAATASDGERAWYFFTRLIAKGPNRMKRNVFIARGDPGREGGWFGTGGKYNVSSSNGQRIGDRRGFEFKGKVGDKLVKSAWRMMELRLNPDPEQGRQEAGSTSRGPLVLCKVYRLRNATAEGQSPMAAAEEVAEGEAPGASAVVAPGPKAADEEIGAATAAGPGRKRKAGDEDTGAETVASSSGRQKKTDVEIESADAATTGQIFADNKDPLDAAEQEEQEEPRGSRERQFLRFL